MKNLLFILLLILTNRHQCLGQHFFSSNLCGVTFYDGRGYRFQYLRQDHFPSLNYLYRYKKIGFEFFYNQFKIAYYPWYKSPTVPNTLWFRDRANIGICVHYYLLNKKQIHLSFLAGFGVKGSNDFTYLFTYNGSFPEPKFEPNGERGVGVVGGINAKLFVHKRIYTNITLRQMNLIDNSKFQRNTLVTEVGIGVRLGKLKT